MAIRESALPRSELFVTTKYSSGPIQESVRESLSKVCSGTIANILPTHFILYPKLGLKHLDLYLIHFPRVVEDDFEGSWKEFEKIREDGLAKYVNSLFDA